MSYFSVILVQFTSFDNFMDLCSVIFAFLVSFAAID
jgi:hypothetical protein